MFQTVPKAIEEEINVEDQKVKAEIVDPQRADTNFIKVQTLHGLYVADQYQQSDLIMCTAWGQEQSEGW